jgi:hypothetical protein
VPVAHRRGVFTGGPEGFKTRTCCRGREGSPCTTHPFCTFLHDGESPELMRAYATRLWDELMAQSKRDAGGVRT